MKTIYKYPLKLVEKQVIELPWGSNILDVQEQDGLCLWATVDPNEERKVRRQIHIIGTGMKPIYLDQLKHISTIQMGLLVWHVFEYIEI